MVGKYYVTSHTGDGYADVLIAAPAAGVVQELGEVREYVTYYHLLQTGIPHIWR